MEPKIKNYIKQYDGDYQVIYFFDVDSSDLKYDQQQLNIDIIEYCNKQNSDVVWFNKTIEDVLIGDIVTKNKTKIANEFYIKNKIYSVKEEILNAKKFDLITNKKSNVKFVLDKYLEKK